MTVNYLYRNIFALILLSTVSLSSNAQTTLVLQPNGVDGKDALVASCVPCGYNTTNFGSGDEFSAIAWTNSGNESDVRGLISFDLNSIPSGSVVTNAKLSLYFNPNPSSGNMGSQHSTLSGSNSAYLKKIISPWNENTVTWDNQPATTISGQVLLSSSSNNAQDYPDIDITTLTQEMVNNPAQNMGFMIQLYDESAYRGLLFASSDHPNSSLHPKLEVTYLTSTNGLNHHSITNNLAVVPNPSNGSFTVSIPKEIESGIVDVLDMQGKVVYSNNFQGTQQLLNLDLNKGMYLLRIWDTETVYNAKIVVE
jgi:hypothetical protein